VTKYQAGVLKMFYPESDLILRADVLVHSVHTRDHASTLWERYHALDGRVMMGRSSMLAAGYVAANEVFLAQRFDRNFFRFRANSQFTKRLFLSAFFVSGGKIRYTGSPYQGYGSDFNTGVTYQFTDHLSSGVGFTYSDFFNDATEVKEYDYKIWRSRTTYQLNKYLFLRAIFEYNTFREELTTDLLASFTYIPGTVVHIGYGSLYNRVRWDGGTSSYLEADPFLEMRRGFFFKASYLWRM
jgi:hypothetical protein